MRADAIPPTVPDDHIWHVVPVGDLRDHVTHGARGRCWCVPDVSDEGAGYIVTHHALDGREAFETGQRKAS